MRDYKADYQRQRRALLADSGIAKENRDLFERFLDWEEYKLKRINDLDELDNSTYKTLVTYTQRLKNVALWFDKPLQDITKEDIKRVYDGLEDGTIKNQKGQRFKDRKSYYNKIFKSKPFQMVGKADLAREVIEFYKPKADRNVRFVDEENFRRIVDYARKPEHKLLLWLLWDVGENVNSVLQLRAGDFQRRENDISGYEYIVHLRTDTLKRSRTTRSEITNFSETAEYAARVLEGKEEDDPIFNFGYRYAKKLFDQAVEESRAACKPNNDKPTLKDLRSGMACYLLRAGWTVDEVKARLGHTPSSRAIDHYVNYLAIGRDAPKQKVESKTISELKKELEEMQKRLESRERMYEQRLKTIMSEAGPAILAALGSQDGLLQGNTKEQ